MLIQQYAYQRENADYHRMLASCCHSWKTGRDPFAGMRSRERDRCRKAKILNRLQNQEEEKTRYALLDGSLR
jgi:hypothetical protein